MKLVIAVRHNLRTQPFGANYLNIYQKWGMKGHNGTDFLALHGDDVRWDCVDCYGKVVSLSTDENEGLGVVIRTEDKDGIFQHRFWHLKDISVKVGQIVGTGDLLGHADNTGYSTGNHLHRDLKPLICKNGVYSKAQPDNGYAGAIDIEPFIIKNIYVLNYVNNLKEQVSILTKVISLFYQLIGLKK